MEEKYYLKVRFINYDGPSYEESLTTSLEDIEKYKDIIRGVNSRRTNWNWFNHIPDTWDGEKYVTDNWLLTRHIEEKLGIDIKPELFIEFFKKYSPNGADGIKYIKAYRVMEEEIKLD